MPTYKTLTIPNFGKVMEKLEHLYIYYGKVKRYTLSGKQVASFLENRICNYCFTKSEEFFLLMPFSSLYWFMECSRKSNCYNANGINQLSSRDIYLNKLHPGDKM